MRATSKGVRLDLWSPGHAIPTVATEMTEDMTPHQMTTTQTEPAAESTAARMLLAVLGLTSVVPLLAWVFGIGSFRSWFLVVTVPGALALACLVLRPRASEATRRIVTVGVFAGLIGTVGYDVVRVPFVFGAGYRLLSPIESYGVLLTGASSSSGWTDLAGWGWHLSNGIGFGITYVAIAEGRRWQYGVAWAMALESASVLTPFAGYYSLAGKTAVILIAYAAHVPFGLAVGWCGQHSEEIYRGLRGMTRVPNSALIGAAALLLVVWLRPTDSHRVEAAGSADVVIEDGSMHPEFVRVGEGGCRTFVNVDEDPYEMPEADEAGPLDAGGTQSFCFTDPGVHRVRVDGEPFHGGFVIVDPSMATDGSSTDLEESA